MKKLLFSLSMLAVGISANAQQDVYALTGKAGPNIIFSDFRSIDIKKGVSGEVFLTDTSMPEVFSQVLNQKVASGVDLVNGATATAMATLAYDGNNLVYMPLFSNNIYILNGKTKDITLLEPLNKTIKTTACELGSQFTRMATGYNGSVYALTNSGSQLLKITSKNGHYSVTDLGALKNMSGENAVSMSVVPAGYGGDMVADAENNLYVFAASGNIFKVSTDRLTYTHIGKISGLPENYSLNGAAVNASGNVIVASAKAEGFYEVNMETLQASAITSQMNIPVYDLASRYYLNDQRASTALAVSGIEVFPTRVDQKFINISTPQSLSKSNLNVNIYDASGALVLKKVVSPENSARKIDLSNLNSGLYIVNVADGSGKVLNTTKIIVTN